MARNAFRIGLRDDTPIPVARAGAGTTQELDPSDILEVQDMAEAIARAEKIVAAPRSSRPDMFESLGRRWPAPTDDTAGPASPAPPHVATPIPPSSPFAVQASAALSVSVAPPSPLPASRALPTPSVRGAVPAPVPRYVTMPSAPQSSPEEDAFYHPVGRMRSLADATLDGYRPEPTLLVRAATRRKRFSLVLLAVLLPLLVLAAIAIFASTDNASASPLASSPGSLSVAAPGKTPLTTTSAAAKSASATAPSSETAAAPPPSPASPSMPVFDVKNLPSAGPIRSGH